MTEGFRGIRQTPHLPPARAHLPSLHPSTPAERGRIGSDWISFPEVLEMLQEGQVSQKDLGLVSPGHSASVLHPLAELSDVLVARLASLGLRRRPRGGTVLLSQLG